MLALFLRSYLCLPARRQGQFRKRLWPKPADTLGVAVDHGRRKPNLAVKSPHGADPQWPRSRLAVRHVWHRNPTSRLRPWRAVPGRESLGLSDRQRPSRKTRLEPAQIAEAHWEIGRNWAPAATSIARQAALRYDHRRTVGLPPATSAALKLIEIKKWETFAR
jgi:hypothetical protein